MLVFFLLLIAVLIAIIVAIFKSSAKATKKSQEFLETNKNNFVFQNEFELKGAKFNICKTTDTWEGKYKGYLAITYSKYDKYAIGVFTEKGIQVGWLPKNSIKVYNYLKNYKITNLPCEGYYTYQQERENTVLFKTHEAIT